MCFMLQKRFYIDLRRRAHTWHGMRPKDPQQEGVGWKSRQSKLSIPVHAKGGVSLLHLRYDGLAASRASEAEVRAV